MIRRSIQITSLAVAASLSMLSVPALAEQAIDIGGDRELFVDHYLIDNLTDARLQLHQPIDRGPVLYFDAPTEDVYATYTTVLKDGDTYRMYYRSSHGESKDPTDAATGYAESKDGINWTKPNLGLFEVKGHKDNNIILHGYDCYLGRNFSPMIDTNPEATSQYRYKAIAGRLDSQKRPVLYALGSPDGIHWELMSDEPVLTFDEFAFDSQNVVFWSESEQKYLAYCRLWVKDPDPNSKVLDDIGHGIRTIGRSESNDFLHWSKPKRMSFTDTGSTIPSNHFYTNQTYPYFRAPQVYLSFAARFMAGRQVLSSDQAQKFSSHLDSYKDVSDTVLMTTRGGYSYDRTFMGAFIAPGIGAQNWVTRTNYASLNAVPTGEHELSIYVNRDYGQKSAHLSRYTLRLDGFASVHADLSGGEMVTKPFRFTGNQLELNYATSAAGDIRVEIQNADGTPIPGYKLEDCRLIIGDETDAAVAWAGGGLSPLAGQTVRLRFVLRDADLYAMRFTE